MRPLLLLSLSFSCALLVPACAKTNTSASSTAEPSAAPAVSPAVAATAAAVASAAAAAASGAAAIASAAAAPAGSPTVAVAFTDIAGNINAPAIVALAQLGVLEATSGAFAPDAPVKRRDFVRWLFKTNNAVFANSPSHLIHPGAADEKPAFKDLPASDPDFPYVQGMNDTGNSVGFPDGTFKPDQTITREQAIAIKSVLDHGGISPQYLGAKNAGFARFNLPGWKDKDAVSVTYVGPVADDIGEEGDTKINNIGRTFGAISVFRPQATLSRGEACSMFQVIGGHNSMQMGENAMRTVAATLNPSPSPSP